MEKVPKKFHLSVYWERFQGKNRSESLRSCKLDIQNHSFLQILKKPCEKIHICRCIKPNVFTYASSYTSCHARHDNFTTSWKTDNRCLLYEMFMMSVSIDLPGVMRLTGSSQPISCPRLLFHYLSLYLEVSMFWYLFSSSPLLQVESRQIETDATTWLQLMFTVYKDCLLLFVISDIIIIRYFFWYY